MAAAAGWGAEERGHGRCAPQGECWSGHGRGCWQWRLVGFAQGLRVIVRCFEGSSLRVAASSSCSSKEHARTCMLEGAVLVGAGKAGHSAVLLLLSAESLRSRVRSSCESCSASRFLSASDGTPPRAIRAAQAIEATGRRAAQRAAASLDRGAAPLGRFRGPPRPHGDKLNVQLTRGCGREVRS